MKKFWAKKIIGFILIAILITSLLSWVVMSLWNGVLAVVLHVSVITFWQAMGILVLSKILFGGFKGKGRWGGGPGNMKWRREMQNKWREMSSDEREKFKQEWRNRCRSWKMGDSSKMGMGNDADLRP